MEQQEQQERPQQSPRTHTLQLSRTSSLRKLIPHVRHHRASIASPLALSTEPPTLQDPTRRRSRTILGEAEANYLPNIIPGVQGESIEPRIDQAANRHSAIEAYPRRDISDLTEDTSLLPRLDDRDQISTPELQPRGAIQEGAPKFWDLRKHVGHKSQRQLLQKTMKNPNTNLGISVSAASNDSSGPLASPLNSPRTPRTPHSPSTGFKIDPPADSSPLITGPPPPRQPSPGTLTKASKSFFSNKGASRSTTKLPKSTSPAKTSNASPKPPGAMASVYSLNRGMGSSPELTVTNDSVDYEGQASSFDPRSQSHSDAHMTAPTYPVKKKPSKHKIFGIGRKGSVKDEEVQRDTRLDRTIREKSSMSRNHSADGITDNRDSGSSHGIRHTGTRAADGLGRAAKGLFGKLASRSAGGTDSREALDRQAKAERDAAEAQKAFLSKNYKVIHQPLEIQARTTRICKRLEECKDKTEFWLPALAYRCIDYLNDKGMTHEGLYRVPGSEREIRNWIWRFDNEHDIDLLSEEELYDINTISSMFKAWLRDLPDEVFPKSIQHKISATVPNLNEQPEAPEILKTELSNLPPFNYYLLFAVTAHITMLLNASKENKMTFHNLCVCFMPALKMELPCFQWLILDWKNCWQGCATEKDYLTREYSLNAENKEHSESIPSRSIPVQHFDRYPPPHAKSIASTSDHDREGASTLSTSLPHPSPQERAGDNDRGIFSTGVYQPTTGRDVDSQHSSPAKKSADTPVAMPTIRPPDSRRGKKPLPLESTLLGSVRRDSESSANNPATRDDDKSSTRADSRNGHAQARPNQTELKGNNKVGLLPELAPVQPLSPFGGLDSFSRVE